MGHIRDKLRQRDGITMLWALVTAAVLIAAGSVVLTYATMAVSRAQAQEITEQRAAMLSSSAGLLRQEILRNPGAVAVRGTGGLSFPAEERIFPPEGWPEKGMRQNELLCCLIALAAGEEDEVSLALDGAAKAVITCTAARAEAGDPAAVTWMRCAVTLPDGDGALTLTLGLDVLCAGDIYYYTAKDAVLGKGG